MRQKLGDATLDRDRRALFRGAGEVHLTPRAYRLLELLLDRRPNAVSFEDIYAVLWPDTVVSDGSVKVLVNEVRAALRDDARRPLFIRTLPSFGYAFCGEVVEEESALAPVRHALVWAGTTFVLAEGETVCGRDRGAGVFVGHPSVSHRHARIVVRGARAEVEDLGSRNGTFVGTTRLTARAPLFDGDQLVLGSATLTYRGPAAGPSVSTAAPR